MKWVRITNTENIPPREGRSVLVDSLSVAIFNTGDQFLAVENRCPHSGGPLADGILAGRAVTCPLHSWRICLESGKVSKPCEIEAAPVRTYPVKVEDGVILLSLTEDSRAH